MTLVWLIIFSNIWIFRIPFPVDGTAILIINELPSLLLIMAYFAYVMAWTIELYRIYPPGIILGRNFLFLDKSVNCSMDLLSAVVTFISKLAFSLSAVLHNKEIFLHLLIFLILIFTQVNQAVQGNHSVLQVIHRHTSTFAAMQLLYYWLVKFWILHYDFWS